MPICWFSMQIPYGKVGYIPRCRQLYFLSGHQLPSQLYSIMALGWYQLTVLDEQRKICEWVAKCHCVTAEQPQVKLATSRLLIQQTTYCAMTLYIGMWWSLHLHFTIFELWMFSHIRHSTNVLNAYLSTAISWESRCLRLVSYVWSN